MTNEERDVVSELHTLQGQAQNLLSEIAQHMGVIATSGIEVSQEHWDQLLQGHDSLRATIHYHGQKLDALARAAGLPV